MKLTTILYWVIILILTIGIYGASGLVFTEITIGNGCPKIGAIPACIIIIICLILPLISHILKKWNVVYFLFTGVAALIAFYATIMQLIGNAECPKTEGGIPMCYLSLLIFTTLIILKTKQLNYVNNNESQKKHENS